MSEANGMPINTTEIIEFWRKWLVRKHDGSTFVSLAARDRIMEQGDILIRDDPEYWFDHMMSDLFERALILVSADPTV